MSSSMDLPPRPPSGSEADQLFRSWRVTAWIAFAVASVGLVLWTWWTVGAACALLAAAVLAGTAVRRRALGRPNHPTLPAAVGTLVVAAALLDIVAIATKGR
jgi:drug/metabolite transporter (DMT)-like permease